MLISTKLHLSIYIYLILLGHIIVKFLCTDAVSLAYIDFDPNIIKEQESTFTCEASDGDP